MKKFNTKVIVIATTAVFGSALYLGCGGGDGGGATVQPVNPPGNTQSSNGCDNFAGVLTAHNDLLRTGRNMNETCLNRSNVASSNFGKVGALPVDGQVYAQPLVVNHVQSTVNGLTAARDLVLIATENDSVYAYDITPDKTTGLPAQKLVWQRSVTNNDLCTINNVTETSTCNAVVQKTVLQPLKDAEVRKKVQSAQASGLPITDIQSGAPNIAPVIGITATPVVDPSNANGPVMYFTAMTNESATATPDVHWRLHAVYVATGKEIPGSPVEITGTYAGLGAGASSGKITFDPIRQLSRAGLVLSNSGANGRPILTVAFTSFDDQEPTHGWVFSYDPKTLNLVSTWMTTPNSGDGTIWQGGGAPAVDTDGSIIFSTGNGDPSYNAIPQRDLADSVVRLKWDTTTQGLTMQDYFSPYNHTDLASKDVDLGSGAVLLLPDEVSTSPHLLTAGGKSGTVYVLNREALGGYSADQPTEVSKVVQEMVGVIPGGTNSTGMFTAPAYYNNKLFVAANRYTLNSIPVTGGATPLNQNAIQKATYSNSATGKTMMWRAASPSVSASGANTQDAIVWFIDTSIYQYSWVTGSASSNAPTNSNGSAVLFAYSTDDLSKPLYTSPVTQVPTASLSKDPLWQNGDNCAGLDPNAAGCATKFAVPTIANGLVFVGTDTEVSVYGLKPSNNSN